MGIYVEIPICASMDELWEKTQNPQLHQRWDLRFKPNRVSSPGKLTNPEIPVRTRIGFGFTIDGNGESTGNRDGDGGARTSSLKFWSADPKSLIKVGSGYWKYVPTETTIRFFTWYDYETRFSVLGKVIEYVHLSPTAGMGHAWSFDRLRLWIEKRDSAGSFASSRLSILSHAAQLPFIWLFTV